MSKIILPLSSGFQIKVLEKAPLYNKQQIEISMATMQLKFLSHSELKAPLWRGWSFTS